MLSPSITTLNLIEGESFWKRLTLWRKLDTPFWSLDDIGALKLSPMSMSARGSGGIRDRWGTGIFFSILIFIYI
jgi:hypothetical protein